MVYHAEAVGIDLDSRRENVATEQRYEVGTVVRMSRAVSGCPSSAGPLITTITFFFIANIAPHRDARNDASHRITQYVFTSLLVPVVTDILTVQLLIVGAAAESHNDEALLRASICHV